MQTCPARMRNRTMGAWRADDSVECELSKDCGEGREEEEEGRPSRWNTPGACQRCYSAFGIGIKKYRTSRKGCPVFFSESNSIEES